MPKCWEIMSAAGQQGKRVVLTFYGDITHYPATYYAEDKSPQEIADALKLEGEIEHITARINSYGGSAFAGLAIYNILKNWPAPVTTYNDGITASAAGPIFLAGDERIMNDNTVHMMHKPSSVAYGDAKEMAKAIEMLDAVQEGYVKTYAGVTGMDEEKARELIDAESWLNAEQCLELGIATSIDRTAVAACAGTRTVNGVAVPEWLTNKMPDEVKAAVFTEAAEAVTADAATAGSEVEDTDNEVTPEAERLATMRAELEYDAAEAAADERQRIQAIDDLAAQVPGSEALATKAKYEQPISSDAFARALITEGYVSKALAMAAVTADGADTRNLAPQGIPDADTMTAQIEARVRRITAQMQTTIR